MLKIKIPDRIEYPESLTTEFRFNDISFFVQQMNDYVLCFWRSKSFAIGQKVFS